MAENLTIARPYAQAVFEIAQADQTFDQWSQSLEALAVAVQNEQVQAMLAQASTNEAGAKLLIELLGDLIDQKGQNFVYVVGENNRFAVLPEIFEEFVRLRDDYLKVKQVEITSARPLAEADLKAIVKKLEQKYQATVRVTQTVDPEILGGIIIRMGDEVIDASVKTNLSRLSSTLK